MINPFNPSFGTIPKIYLDRNQLLNNLATSLENPSSPYRTSLIYGMRGIGKTTFMTDLADKMSDKSNWMVIDLAMNRVLMKTLLGEIYESSNLRIKKLLNSINGIKFSTPGLELNFNKEDKFETFQILFERMLKVLKKEGKSLLITIDEIGVSQELIDFAAIYQIMLRKKYNVSLIMTGLPSTINSLQNVEGLTFLLRSGRVKLDLLNILDIKLKYQQIFAKGSKKISNENLNRLAKLTKGYSYAFQLLGYLVWQQSKNEVTSQTINSVLTEYKIELARNAYGKMFSELRPIQRHFLSVMAHSKNEIVKSAYIAKKLHKSVSYVSVYRKQLLDSQLIQAPARGVLEFSLPYFKQFILDNESLYLS